jgi:hypothetical protein
MCAIALGARPTNAALVAHWPFDESMGLVADDAVGASDGTLVDFPGDDSQWQAGIIGTRFSSTAPTITSFTASTFLALRDRSSTG